MILDRPVMLKYKTICDSIGQGLELPDVDVENDWMLRIDTAL